MLSERFGTKSSRSKLAPELKKAMFIGGFGKTLPLYTEMVMVLNDVGGANNTDAIAAELEIYLSLQLRAIREVRKICKSEIKESLIVVKPKRVPIRERVKARIQARRSRRAERLAAKAQKAMAKAKRADPFAFEIPGEKEAA